MNKKNILSFAVVILSIITTVFFILPCQQSSINYGLERDNLYSIGDKGPAGGIIFFINPEFKRDGWKYLEVAPDDIGSAKWSSRKKNISGAKGIPIGTGKKNTLAIIDSIEEERIAARLCAEYRGGGENDWFLPSRDELDLIYKLLHKRKFLKLPQKLYWSSTESDVGRFAWSQHFFTGSQYSLYKHEFLLVRPIRAF